MVKFSKKLEAQLIPEWKDAFVNYWKLRKHAKKIKLAINSRQPQPQLTHDYGRSIFDPIRFIAMKISTCKFFNSNNNNTEIIQVTSKSMEDGSDEEQVFYQTELIQLFTEEDEVRLFFESLDEELNKVNQFYKKKESEFVERGEVLNKQLQILLDLKKILSDRQRKPNTGTLQRSCSSSPLTSDFSESQSTVESYVSSPEMSQTDVVVTVLDRMNGVNFINSATQVNTKKGEPKMSMSPATTPTGTISTVTSMLWEDLVNNPKKEAAPADFINRKIRRAQKMIKCALVELYRGLGLLKTYSSLNMEAFTKILKKFDKVSNQQASASYLNAVKRSHFISSDKIVRLMDEVESIFTKHFANDDRRKAMKFLRPQQQKDYHTITFFVGLFTGCFVSLFSVYIILAHLSGMFSPNKEATYMETVYPVLSVFALLSLHLFCYGCNLYMWKNRRINYTFIFEFVSTTGLKYRDAFLICTTFMTSAVVAMVIHLILRTEGFSPTHVDNIPGILLLISIACLVCPLDIFYRSTRYCFLRIIRNIVCSPFYKSIIFLLLLVFTCMPVLMVDFFMADQLTSQIPSLRHLESTACYFVAGSLKTHKYATCQNGKLYRQLAYVVSFLPYYWRAMQCARRWFDEYDLNHLANMGKYVSAMVAAGARLKYATENNHLWFFVVLVTSAVATVYQLYWDFVKDWGLLNPKSRNPWLRDDLILKKKSIYYISIALNVVLRVVWIESILRFHVNPVETHLLDFFLASLEVIRRGHWNFYRLENEHVNNVGKFRAVKTVPLPFCETDSDG